MEGYQPGTRLIIELNTGEIYEGTYHSGNSDTITLNNVSQYPSGETHDFSCNFYITEIASVKEIADGNKIQTPPESTEEEPPVQDHVLSDYDRIKDLVSDYIYIPEVDNIFSDTMRNLNMCDTISVINLGGNFGRSSKISVLGIGTKTKIYVFDLKPHGEIMFAKGLREILESEDTLKVIHNSKIFSDCIFHSHQVKLNYVFDTQVADVMILKKDKKDVKMKSFEECVSTYLNLPSNILNVVEPSLKHIMTRPLSNETKTAAATKAAYLYYLKKKLERMVFEEFYSYTNRYLACMRECQAPNLLKYLDNSLHLEDKTP